MRFHYITNMTIPLFKNPCPVGHEIYNFGCFVCFLVPLENFTHMETSPLPVKGCKF